MIKKLNITILIFFLSISFLWIIGSPVYVFGHSATPLTSIHKIGENLSQLTSKEHEYLTNFFRLQFFIGGFGYTIYGTKPMSFDMVNKMSDHTSVEGIDYMAMEHILDRYRLKEGWDVWNKYKHLFPLQGFSLFTHPSPIKEADSFLEVVLINHKIFLNVVRENLEDFHLVLGSPLLPEQILQEYLRGEGVVFDQIRNHDGLFGTLLGYGRDNSWEFKKRGGGYTLEAFTQVDPRGAKHVLPPLFKVLPGTKETMDLRIAYEEQRLFIDTIYQKDDFLSHVLMALYQDPLFFPCRSVL